MEGQHLVNGFLMKKYIGQSVRVYLKVENISSGGKQVQGITTDKKSVDLTLDQPLNQPLSGWIEVFGVPANTVTIKCSEIIVFPNDENAEPLDEDAYNGIVMALDNMRDFDETVDDEEH